VNTRRNTIRNTILGFTRQARITAYKEKGSHGSDRTRPADILMKPFGDFRSPVDSYGCFGERASRLVGLLAKNFSTEENTSNSLCQLVPFIYGSIQITLKREQGKAILGRGQRFSRWANRHNPILPQSPSLQLPSPPIAIPHQIPLDRNHPRVPSRAPNFGRPCEKPLVRLRQYSSFPF
jgi:hypothetical protein